MDFKIDRWIGALSAVMQTLYLTTVVKKEPRQKVKLSIYHSIYFYILIYGHEI